MTTTTQAGELRLALDEIRVRELDVEHVDNVAQSIALRGRASALPLASQSICWVR
jgi:hypothetical protein